MTHRFWISAALLVSVAGAASAQGTFIAGLHPDRRPDGAPTVADQPASPEQLAKYLRGVVSPVPGNVESIAATGHWFVPLRTAGMTPPYDPRGWHVGPAAAAAGSSAASSAK